MNRQTVRAAAPAFAPLTLAAPPGCGDALLAALAEAGPVATQPFERRHYDTSERRLAGCGIVLALCLDAGRWSQRLELDGDGDSHGRCLHVAAISTATAPTRAPAPPGVDWRRHRGSAALRRATALLRQHGSRGFAGLALVESCAAQGARHSVQIATPEARLQLAAELGEIRCGTERLPIARLHLELLGGPQAASARLARRWVRRHRLWIEAEALDERLRRLALGAARPAVARARVPRLDAEASAGAAGMAARAIIASCCEQILGNAAALAAERFEGEHVHQLRIGLRRLRCALRLLDRWPCRPPRHVVRPLTRAFRTFGAYRDRETVLAKLRPRLLGAGAAGVAWTAGHGAPVDVARAVRRPAFQCALITLLAHADARTDARDCSAAPADGQPLRALFEAPLQRLQRRLARAAQRFARLPWRSQHRVRKRLKRLRYLSEFASTLFDPGRVAGYLAALEPAQDALGACNDEAIARAQARHWAGTDRDARFAVRALKRSLKRSRDASLRRAGKRLREAAAAAPFWAAPGRQGVPAMRARLSK
ncbi:MAG: CHAD domain-containing protein [Burkholderiaceae bacterium]